MKETHLLRRFRVEGMDCAACGTKVENAVRRLPGITDVNVGVTSETLTIRHDGSADLEAVQQAVNRLGYKASPLRPDSKKSAERYDHLHDDHKGAWWTSKRAMLAGMCGLIVSAYAAAKIVPSIEVLAFLAALGIGLVPIGRRAFNAARSGTPFSIESLMMIAAVGAVTISATEEAAMVAFLFLVGEMLEGVAAFRARANIRGLTDLTPKTALLLENGKTREVHASAIEITASRRRHCERRKRDQRSPGHGRELAQAQAR